LDAWRFLLVLNITSIGAETTVTLMAMRKRLALLADSFVGPSGMERGRRGGEVDWN